MDADGNTQALVNQIENLRGALKERTDTYNSLASKYSTLDQNFENYKTAVFDRAVQCKKEERWCTAGFNAAMDDLGLPHYVDRFAARLTVRVIVTGTSDEDVATNWIHSALESGDSDVSISDINIDDIDADDD